jgi:type IV fimbrial biogenesis protein FimT
MMTIFIAAIVLTLGVPSFQEMSRNNQLTTQANDLVSAFNLARSEAVKRRSTVRVCTSNNQTSCVAGTWQDGWIVLDVAGNEVLHTFGRMKGATTVTSAINQVNYVANGFLQPGVIGMQTLRLCSGAGKPGREIRITPTGRPATVDPHPTC